MTDKEQKFTYLISQIIRNLPDMSEDDMARWICSQTELEHFLKGLLVRGPKVEDLQYRKAVVPYEFLTLADNLRLAAFLFLSDCNTTMAQDRASALKKACDDYSEARKAGVLS